MNRPRQGEIIVLTGDGKGKSSSAFGMVLRAVGWRMRVCVVQFIKGKRPTGEERAASLLPGVAWFTRGEGFSWDPGDPDRHRLAALGAWQFCQDRIRAGEDDLVVLDEINYAMSYGWLSASEVGAFIAREKPAPMHLILTGRNAPPEIILLAHTVTRMEVVKHAFQSGLKATRGIEF